jgi:lysophospholipase L1-like esterase
MFVFTDCKSLRRAATVTRTRSRALVAIMTAFAIVAVLVLANAKAPRIASAASITIPTEADTYAIRGAPSTNFGTSCCLAAGGDATNTAYLRFAVPSGVTGASLTLSTGTQTFAGSSSAFKIAEADNNWGETTLTYGNRPAVSPTVLGTFTGATVNGKTTVTLTGASTLAGREVTLAITGGSDALWLWSREHGTSTVPTLTVTSGNPAAPTVGVIGDSIAQGCCSSSSTTSTPVARPFWRVTAETLGWAEPAVDAQGGTGYLTAGAMTGHQPYSARIGPFLDAHPGLQALVIEGGGNDPASDQIALTNAVTATFDTIKTKAPTAHVYVLGPYSPNGSGYAVQRSIISQSASAHGFVFVDQVAEGWMIGRSDLLWSGNFHPNEAGHDLLGRRLAGDLAILACKGCLP